MAPRYPHSQLTLLLIVAGVAGLGLAVGAWRQAYPELADRIERFDVDAPVGAGTAVSDAARRGQRAPQTAAPPGSPPRGQGWLASGAGGGPPFAGPVDPNRATADELALLPGIGPVQAARIVAAREAAGPFASVEDLARVRGLGPVRIERLRPLLAIEAPVAGERP